jgi:CheY-like chemotaxis protein
MAFDNHNTQRYIYLSDDDREFFADAVMEIDPDVILKEAEDGMYLMDDLLRISPGDLPDFIFLDINMPRKTGLECLEEIRNHENLRVVNVVMLSTSNDPDNIQKAMELGATFYAVKPSCFEKLKSILDEILGMNLVSALGESRKFLLV